MSDNNGWPGEPGVPLNPDWDGWHWIKPKISPKGGIQLIDESASRPMPWNIVSPLSHKPAWNGVMEPKHAANAWQYIGPVLTPAEVDARLSEARRVALGECISICNAVAHANRVEYPAKWKDRPEGIPHDWQQAWETCAETAEDIAAAIRALGEKE